MGEVGVWLVVVEEAWVSTLSSFLEVWWVQNLPSQVVEELMGTRGQVILVMRYPWILLVV